MRVGEDIALDEFRETGFFRVICVFRGLSFLDCCLSWRIWEASSVGMGMPTYLIE